MTMRKDKRQWIGARFFDAGEICKLRLHSHLSSFLMKENSTEQTTSPLALNWSQVTHKKIKATAGPSKYVNIIYFFIYAYISLKSFKRS